MRFNVTGADKETGDDVDVVMHANSREGAEAEAIKRGILVSAIKEIPQEKDVIELIEETPSAGAGSVTPLGGDGAAAHAHGKITLSANSPGEKGFTAAW